MGDFEENEKRYKMMDEQERCKAHNCVDDAENCDTIHPSFAKNVMASGPRICEQNRLPKHWRKWFQSPKTCIWYINQHTLKHEAFNLTEVFKQFGSGAKLNIIGSIFYNLLDDNEKSMFLSAVMEKKQ